MKSPFTTAPSRRSLVRGLLAGAGAAAVSGVLPSAASAAGTGPERRGTADHVILIAWDGFDPRYVDLAPLPHLRRLARRGSLSTSRGVMTSITNPSWASVATGAWPEKTLNTAYFFDSKAGVARGQTRDIAVPTIAQAVRAQGGTVASAQWFIVQNYGTAYGDPEGVYTQPGGPASRRFDDIIAVIEGRPVRSGTTTVTAPRVPDLMAVYCDELDALGHAGGEDSPALPDAITMLDGQLGRLVEATKDAGIYGRTAFVLMGDHGMTTFTRRNGAQILDAVASAGHTAQILGSGQAPSPGTDVAIVVGGVGSVHLLGEAAADPGAARRIKAAIEKADHVTAVYDKDWQRAQRMSPLHGELIIQVDPGWSIGTGEQSGPAGRHGAPTEQESAFLIAGAGVLPNRLPRAARHVDVAPTMAALLGIAPPAGAQGRVLTEVLRPGPRGH
ncbi:alkaline phosphatase family protein [Streptomyces sp. NPDC004838]